MSIAQISHPSCVSPNGAPVSCVCTGFLLGVLVLGFPKVLTAKRTVSIKSTGLIDCTGFLLSVLYFSIIFDLDVSMYIFNVYH